MKVIDLFEEAVSIAALQSALNQGWVRIRYRKLNGMDRILFATLDPSLYTYVFKLPPGARPKRPYLITVWERNTGWRSLYKNRIGGWKLG
jgi:WYL_2, Sm-like SH3 beta-barrel fold